jgi:hypothetical protein
LGECLVHEKLLAEFRKANLTGYRTRPATLRFRDRAVTTEYQELVVTGWGGMARPESGIKLRKSCPACRWKKYTPLTDAEQLIDWNQWTGDDFFIVWPLQMFTLITERAAELLLGLDIRSFAIAGLDDTCQFGFGTGRLSNRMPLDLALRYGGPLGLE